MKTRSFGIALFLGLGLTVSSATLLLPGCSVETDGLFGPGTGPDPDAGDGGGGTGGGDSGTGGEGGKPPTSVCGNGKQESPEACDGKDLAGQTCKMLLGSSYNGDPKCLDNCTFDTSTCVPPATCGNGSKDGDEQCDGSIGSATCASVLGSGYTGSLACSAACTYNTSACIAPPICGDGVKNGTEQCEGSDLGSATCASVKGAGWTGSLACKADCTFNTSSCKAPPGCGDGVKNGAEQCDGSDVGSATCATVLGAGYTGGLACTAGCTYNTSACVAPASCGDGVKNGGEVCDTSDFGGKTCTTYKGVGSVGSLACTGSCTVINPDGCSLPTCVAGATGTSATSISMTGVIDSAGTFHPNTGGDVYDAAPPVSLNINGLEIPGQGVLAMYGGINFHIRKGPTAISKVWYIVDTTSLSGIPECAVSLKDMTCQLKVAQSFRCGRAPYWESGAACPSPAVSFSAPQAATADHSETDDPASLEWHLVLVDDNCP